MKQSLIIFALVIFCSSLVSAGDGYIWVEAETAADKREQSNDWYDPVDKKTSLSGHDWWHSFDEPGMKSGYAVVPFSVKEAGTYRLWIRLNLSSTGLSMGVDGAEVREIPYKKWQNEQKRNRDNIKYERRIFDETYVSHDGSNRHKLVWVKEDEIELTAGDHTIRFQVKPGKDTKGWAAVDCFVLAKKDFDFRPRMFYKPEEKVKTAPELDPAKSWPVTFPKDQFKPSPIDLRDLNEKEAGEHGFIRLSKDGEGFVRGDGEPIRFWSGSEYAWRIPFKDKNLTVSDQEAAEVAHKARWSAKRGINMVRFHGHLPPSGKKKKLSVTRDDINQVDLHGAWYMVAAFKKEGIYSTISPYWGSHTDNEEGWDLGFKGGSLAGLVFFYEPVQEMYKGWLKKLLTEENPYTGIPLKDDPALAIIQLQNEDSILFYTESQIKGKPREVLLKKFGDFLTKKYGSLEEAFKRYKHKYESGWDMRGEDSVEKGTAGLMQMWFFTLDAKVRAQRWDPQTRARMDDQLEFYTMLMHDFNEKMADYIKNELGCRQIINAGNWKSVDAVTAGDAERYSYTPNEVIGRNAYYGCLHNGINVGWQILTQQVYTSWSALKRPAFLPMNVKQVAGHPFIIPESLWVPPNLYKSEGPLVVAGQLSLTGVDSFYWFASGGDEWADIQSKWPYNTIMQMGQFPATALAFREGYIAQAEEPAVYEERSLEDIWTQKIPLIAESPIYDPNRDKGEMTVESSVTTPVNPLAFVVGPVKVKYGGSAKNNRVSDRLDTLIDEDNKIITSITGQITTDYGKGIYKVNAPRCQGAAGFLALEPEIGLSDISIRCTNDYASIVAVPLDGMSLSVSKKILVQVGTVARPRGWIVRDRNIQSGGKDYDGFQIMRKGGLPLMVADTEAEIVIKNPNLSKGTALDINGQPKESEVKVDKNENGVKVILPKDALYTVIE